MWCYRRSKRGRKWDFDALAKDCPGLRPRGKRRRAVVSVCAGGAQGHAWEFDTGLDNVSLSSGGALFPRAGSVTPVAEPVSLDDVQPVSALTQLLLSAAAELCKNVVAAAKRARDHRARNAVDSAAAVEYDDPLVALNVAARTAVPRHARSLYRMRGRSAPSRLDRTHIRGCDVHAAIALLPVSSRFLPSVQRFALFHSQPGWAGLRTKQRTEKRVRVPALNLAQHARLQSLRSAAAVRPSLGISAEESARLRLGLW